MRLAINLWIPLAIFLVAYVVNAFFITVLYHRALAHRAVRLGPWGLRLTEWAGPWVTGIDPKGWACMHRLHHVHSDTERDPHSPHHWGLLGVAWGQLKSYEDVLRRLLRQDPETLAMVADIPFDVSALNRRKIWFLPYVLHTALGLLIAVALGSPLAGVAYFLGIMSHPFQGWMVNALAHRFGYRSYATSDQSRNNRWVAALVFGEGYQNNHHAFPNRARFGHTPSEPDLGYWLCRFASLIGLVKFC